MKRIKKFYQFSLLEKTIGIENIRNKWYSNIDKKIFYKIINIDPTSIRKKDFSKPGKYSKWLLREYKNGNLKLDDINNLEYRNKINYYLFIFSTGWFKSNQKKKHKRQDIMDIIDEVDILKYDLKKFMHILKYYTDDFEFNTNDAKFDVVYSDHFVDIMIPINFTASYKIAKNTEWCSQSKIGFSYWNNISILFRIIPKDKTYDKLKLTWRKDGIWYISCSKYPEISGEKSPFDLINNKENWKLEKIEMDKKLHNHQRWIENSDNINKTMGLISDKAKKSIEKYYLKLK